MSDVSAWSPLDADNNVAPPDGWPEFMMPSGVNNCGRMMMGAVRRMYDQQISGAIVLPYLKLVGGQTVSGHVTFSAGITASAITCNSVINAAGNITSSGQIGGATLYSAGLLTAGSISSGNISSTGEISAAGRVNAGGALDIQNSHVAVRLSDGMYYHDNAGVAGLVLLGAGEAGYNSNSHHFNNRAGTAGYAVLNSSGLSITGGLSTTGDATVGGSLTVGVATYVHDTGFGLVWESGTGNRLLNFSGGDVGFVFNVGDGTFYYRIPVGAVWVMRADRFCYASGNTVGGQGDYINMSDRRFKDAASIKSATQGLPEILQLQPVEFKRLPPQDSGDGTVPMWELGFVAQDVAPVLPQAVSVVGVELPDGTGGLSDPEPTLGVTSGAIVAALCNAVKSLDASIKAIETRLTTGGL